MLGSSQISYGKYSRLHDVQQRTPNRHGASPQISEEWWASWRSNHQAKKATEKQRRRAVKNKHHSK